MAKVKDKYPDISTSRSQRIAIWVIAIVMVGGTLISFLIFAIASVNTNVNSDQILYQKALEKQQQQQAEQQAATAAYVPFLDDYEVAAFDPAGVTELGVKTIKEGSGPKAAATDTITANYTGWTFDGAIFDTTKRSADAESTPIQFPLTSVITGWSEGLTGAQAGGIYELTIPAEMAYGGAAGESSTSGPLKFIVEVVSIDVETEEESRRTKWQIFIRFWARATIKTAKSTS
jgi:FKBP-type peptidyl-prolyl cis-trans isomerase